jgi:serine/threonine protein kinase
VVNVPRRLGDFEVQRRIGAGGTAEVFLATKRGAKGTEKRLVVKRLLPEHARSERLRTMFIHEAHLAMRLAHPNLVHVYELSDDPDGGLLLSMEYVDGADLARVLAEVKKRGERLPVPIALRVVEQAARGLHYAHEYKDEGADPLAIVHRDISPQNILVSKSGVVKVADLGVASASIVRDQTGVQPGKLRYMSPEQARGEKVDRRCDVYALGVVLYEVLRLASPYGDRKGAALARSVTNARFDPPLAKAPDIPDDVRPVLLRALAPDPALRTRTARDLAEALAQILFARGASVDDAAVEAALAPYIEAAGEIPTALSSTSDLPRAPAPSAPEISVSDAGSDEAPTVAAAPRAISRDPSSPDGALGPGDAVGRYVLSERLGRGGMAEVFRARDTVLGREVALKLLRTDTESASRERMLREAQAAAKFSHPGSVVVFDVGAHGDTPFIAMELVRGRTLSSYLGDASVPIGRRVRWSAAIARVLAAAHRAGLVHRDVKPSNVMIREDGEVKVLDFGVARLRQAELADAHQPELTAAGAIVGTPGYAAPEQLHGEAVDGRADQFAWGVTTYELFAGRRPWTGDSTGELIAQVLMHPFKPLAEAAPEVPPEVAHAVERALSREPEERFESLDEAADALAPFCEADPAVPASRGALSSVPLGLEGDAAAVPSLRQSSLPNIAIPPSTRAPGPSEPAPAPGRFRWAAALFGAAALLGGGAAWYLASGAHKDAAAPAAATAAATAPVVASVRCAPAAVTGDGDPEIARALGVGACARLGVELDVPWADAGSAETLDVRAEIGPDVTRVSLAIAGQGASASAREPLRAVDLAVAALAPKLAAPPLTPQQIHAWGADDEAGARRISRVFHRRDLRLSASIGSDAVRLLETDPGSPFSHLLALMVSAGGSDAFQHGREHALSLLGKLPPSRQHLLQGVLSVFPAEVDRKEAARLLRQSYAEAPNDADAVSLYIALGLRLGLPEAFALLDKMIVSDPTHAIVPLDNAILRAPDSDVERAVRYAERWIEILPEGRAAQPVAQAFMRAGKLDEVRRSLDFGKRLGLATMGEPITYEGGEMDVQLALLDTAHALEHARALLADPRPFARTQGIHGEVSALFLDGRLRDVIAAFGSGSRLVTDTGEADGAAELLVRGLHAGRWLGRTFVEPAQVEWLRRTAKAQDQLLRAVRAEALIQLALAATGPGAAAPRKAALEAIQAEAAASGDDRVLHDDLVMLTVPLVRALHGDKAATLAYLDAEHARGAVRFRPSIDAGLAFEALGDTAAAERAYAAAADLAFVRESGLERVIAAVRLHGLHPDAPAAGVDHGLHAKLAASADPALIEAIQKLR